VRNLRRAQKGNPYLFNFLFDPLDDGSWPDQTASDGIFSIEGQPGNKIAKLDQITVRMGAMDLIKTVVVAYTTLYIGHAPPPVKDDFLGTWTGQGVYYRNSDTGQWVKMALPATQIAAGDIDGDGTDDLLGIWPSQGGVWVKYSSDGT